MKTLINPPSKYSKFNFKELYEYRDLLKLLTKKNIVIKYKQTIAGFTWALINPVFQMIIFTFVFNKVAKISTNEIPYPIFSFSALVPWVFFSSSLNSATTSLIGQTNLLTKVYFPRIVIPISSILSHLIDYLISFSILIFMMFYYSYYPSFKVIIILPYLTFLIIILSIGIGSSLSAISVQYRDVKYGIGLITSILLYATPVAYPLSAVPDKYKFTYGLNPMVGIIDTFRNALVNPQMISYELLFISSVICFFALFIGVYIFAQFEGRFADVV